MIAIVDYGASNLRSVANAIEALGHKALVTMSAADLDQASGIVLPGVGAFGDGMQQLQQLRLLDALHEEVLAKKKPYLGICLGMQFLAERSLEHGEHRGFAWLPGVVRKIEPGDRKCRVPHMGWNTLDFKRPCPLFDNLPDEPCFYFVHSYHLQLAPSAQEAEVASCWHGVALTSVVQKDNIFGVQFHPEKSQRNGLTVLKNFIKIAMSHA